MSHSFEPFLLQAVAIALEDLVIYTTKRLLRRGGIELKSEDYWLLLGSPMGLCDVAGMDRRIQCIRFSSTDRGAITQFSSEYGNDTALDVYK